MFNKTTTVQNLQGMLIFFVFEYIGYFNVYPLNIKAKTKFEAFHWKYFF